MKARQTKYSKRKIGILKKARELAVLCDTDLALLMFSPTGKPSLCVGQNKSFQYYFHLLLLVIIIIIIIISFLQVIWFVYLLFFFNFFNYCRDLSTVLERLAKMSVDDREER